MSTRGIVTAVCVATLVTLVLSLARSGTKGEGPAPQLPFWGSLPVPSPLIPIGSSAPQAPGALLLYAPTHKPKTTLGEVVKGLSEQGQFEGALKLAQKATVPEDRADSFHALIDGAGALPANLTGEAGQAVGRYQELTLEARLIGQGAPVSCLRSVPPPHRRRRKPPGSRRGPMSWNRRPGRCGSL